MKKTTASKPIVITDDSIVEPALHDARLYRIDFGGKRVSWHFEDSSGQCIKLDLHDVVQMSSHGLAEANIVLDISVETGPAVRSEIIDRLIPGGSSMQQRHRETVMDQLHRRELFLLHLSPSYGGEITVICKTIDYAPVDAKERSAKDTPDLSMN